VILLDFRWSLHLDIVRGLLVNDHRNVTRIVVLLLTIELGLLPFSDSWLVPREGSPLDNSRQVQLVGVRLPQLVLGLWIEALVTGCIHGSCHGELDPCWLLPWLEEARVYPGNAPQKLREESKESSLQL
jgi:hypothetical protein